MSRRDAFDRIVASLHEAMLDESRWPAATARIDDACGIGASGTVLVVGDGEGAHDPDLVREGLLPRATPPRPGTRLLRELLPARRTGAPHQGVARRPTGSPPRPLYRTGAEDVAGVQRGPAPKRVPRGA